MFASMIQAFGLLYEEGITLLAIVGRWRILPGVLSQFPEQGKGQTEEKGDGVIGDQSLSGKPIAPPIDSMKFKGETVIRYNIHSAT